MVEQRWCHKLLAKLSLGDSSSIFMDVFKTFLRTSYLPFQMHSYGTVIFEQFIANIIALSESRNMKFSSCCEVYLFACYFLSVYH